MTGHQDQPPSAERTFSRPTGADRPGNRAFAAVGRAGGAGGQDGGAHGSPHSKGFARTGVPEADLILEAARALRRTWGDGLAAHDLSPHESRALRVVVAHCQPRQQQPSTPTENNVGLASGPRNAAQVVLDHQTTGENNVSLASGPRSAAQVVLDHQSSGDHPIPGEQAPDGGPRLADIAAALRIAPRSATEVVDRLVTRGLVERRPSPTDRRAIEVVPTADGLEASAAVERSWGEAATRFLTPLDPAQREHLSTLLRLLTEGSR